MARFSNTAEWEEVTATHKADIMRFSDGVFLEAARRVAAEFPDIAFEDRIVDNMGMRYMKSTLNI